MPYRSVRVSVLATNLLGFWKPLNIPLPHNRQSVEAPAAKLLAYFEYSSTMSCSLIGICTSSSRLGMPVIRAFSPSRSTSIQEGAGACAVASRADRMVGLLRLDSRTATSSPGLTRNDGML